VESCLDCVMLRSGFRLVKVVLGDVTLGSETVDVCDTALLESGNKSTISGGTK
jgi:hypothetical protein